VYHGGGGGGRGGPVVKSVAICSMSLERAW